MNFQSSATPLRLVFVSLARNQTEFFARLAKSMNQHGHETCLISFHEASVTWARQEGVRTINAFEEARKLPFITNVDDELSRLTARFRIQDLNVILSHEKFVFEWQNEEELKRKFCQYLLVAENFFREELQRPGPQPVVVQELGGFLSCLSIYFVARAKKIEHFFLEPSFFRGRQFFVHNSFMARRTLGEADSVSPEVKAYLQNTLVKKSIVIPTKDKNHYRSIWKKILSPYNFKRLAQKLWGKYVRGEREEFEHIGQHVKKHLRMLVTAQRLKSLYKKDVPTRFVYYPLHVPADMALTIRSPLYLDQYATLDLMARLLPPGLKLVFKEHPALVGAIHFRRTKELLDRYPNLVLMEPGKNNYDLLKAAELIVTVNSKSGVEALACGKKVAVLGDAFYSSSRLIHYLNSTEDLKRALNDYSAWSEPDPESIARFFEQSWRDTYPGEIFETSPENIETYVRSIQTCIAKEYVTTPPPAKVDFAPATSPLSH